MARRGWPCEFVTQSPTPRLGRPIVRRLVLCLALFVSGSSIATAQSDGIRFHRELRAEMERAVDSSLARMLAANGGTATSEEPGGSEDFDFPAHANRDVPSPPSTEALASGTGRAGRLRSLFTPNREIAAYLARYRQRDRGQMNRSLSRFAAYQPQIAGSFANEGVPQELALVGLVESGFDPLAVSPKQARGIWQFVPETGRRYGLRIGQGVDERTDPAKSTRAAARYLADLYKMFGDWPLALAAYNGGEARVLSAVARSGTRDFWQLSRLGLLPAETRAYVPAVLAAILYVHGGALPLSPSTILAEDSGRTNGRRRIFFATLSPPLPTGKAN